ncbi:MAG: hypothetical protein MUP55_01560 [Candidatus Aenigmarchaeota archaeon]|nr:hypothetical protein [Candidatus Aenigmarchaeota archaeon]
MEISKAEKFFETHMKHGYRDTTTNWLGFLRQVKEGYESFMGIAHGVQKDAIQNGWDARKNKKSGTDWFFEFELISGKEKRFFTMTDGGTHGLTGRVLTDSKEYYEDMPKDLRWARFESLAFTKESAGDLGSRGRGKFIFVAASKDNIIFYETFLSDGTYRLGARVVTQTASPVIHWEDEEAKNKLHELTSDLVKPLSHVGTRVIIIEPVKELVENIKSGEFLKYISETWWEIIQKYDAKIYVGIDGKKERVKLNPEFPPPEKEDKGKGIFLWIREHERIPGTRFKIKKLHITYNKSGIDEIFRGISVQRGGMKITSLETKFLPKNIEENIYGYITVDEDCETEIRKAENNEHYQISFRNTTIRCLRDYVSNEITKLAREKLGYGKDLRQIKREIQSKAEEKAIERFNTVAEELGLKAVSLGKHDISKKGPTGPKEMRDIHLCMPEPVFPDPNVRRINYGESLKNIFISAVNKSERNIKVRIKLFIRFGDNVVSEILEKDLEIESGMSSEVFGPFEEKIIESKYANKGKYSLTAIMDSMEKGKKGYRYDKRLQTFYVEQTPPKGGIMEKCLPIELTDMPHFMGQVKIGESGGYILEYNILHNEYLEIEGLEEKMAQYFFRIMAFEICRIDIIEETPILFRKKDLKEPEKMLEQIFDKIGLFMHKYFINEQ